MSLYIKTHPTEPVFELHVTDKVTQEEMDHALPEIEDFVQRHGKVRMLQVVKEYEGFEMSTIWDGLKFDSQYLSAFQRVGIVSAQNWVTAITRLTSALSPVEMKHFAPEEEVAARNWVTEGLNAKLPV